MTQTIGQRLKAEREEQRLTLEKVFEATRIRIQYLQALEADDLSVMPSPVQARGYLRNYAEYLGFDVEHVLQELRELNAQQPASEVIGPAEISSLSPLEEKVPALEPALQTPPPVEMAEAHSAEELTVPVKPKPLGRTSDRPGRHKKTESQAMPAMVETPTRRSGRKR